MAAIWSHYGRCRYQGLCSLVATHTEGGQYPAGNSLGRDQPIRWLLWPLSLVAAACLPSYVLCWVRVLAFICGVCMCI